MAEKTSSKIESALQEIKNDSEKVSMAVSNQNEINLDELNDSTSYDVSKRRKTSLNEDVIFEDNMAINYSIPPESIPYTSIQPINPLDCSVSVMNRAIPLPHYFIMQSVNQPISSSISLNPVYEVDPSQSLGRNGNPSTRVEDRHESGS